MNLVRNSKLEIHILFTKKRKGTFDDIKNVKLSYLNLSSKYLLSKILNKNICLRGKYSY